MLLYLEFRERERGTGFKRLKWARLGIKIKGKREKKGKEEKRKREKKQKKKKWQVGFFSLFLSFVPFNGHQRNMTSAPPSDVVTKGTLLESRSKLYSLPNAINSLID